MRTIIFILMSSYLDEVAPDVVAPGYNTQRDPPQPLKPLDTVIALYDFPGTQPTHLPLNLGDTIHVLSKSDTGWWDGVIMSNTGELMRGWFPNNYVRLVNYVQPVLNKLKSNKELDSITAANTAANVLIPLFTNLLKKNLYDLERNSPANLTRKNSVVSFASSDDEREPKDPGPKESAKESDAKELDPKDPGPDVPQKEQIEPNESPKSDPNASQSPTKEEPKDSEQDSPGKSPKDSKFSSISSGFDANDKISTPRLDSAFDVPTKFTSLEEASVLVQNYRQKTNHMPTWLPRTTLFGNLVYFCPQIDIYCESIPMSEISAEDISNLSLEIAEYSVIQDQLPVTDKSVDNVGVLPDEKAINMFKRDSNVSISSASSSSSIYHHSTHPLYAMDGLFYYHITDLKSWRELNDEFIYIMDLSYKSVKESNKLIFHKHFGKLNKLLMILTLSVRLSHNDFHNTKFENSIKRKVRRIGNSFNQIYINSILLLSYLHYTPRSSNAQLFSYDLSKLNKSVSTNASSISTITQVPLKPLTEDGKEKDLTSLQIIELENENIKRNLSALMKTFLKLTKDKKFRVSDYDGSNSENSENDDDLDLSYHENVQNSNIASLEGKDRHGTLPQNYPRLIANEFNGGNWCNPFFESRNPIFNSSGNDLKNKYHQKVLIDKNAYKSVEKFVNEMGNVSNEMLEFLKPENQHLYYNCGLKEERNTAILRLSYRYLFYASTMVDLIESFDFTVFCLIKRFNSQEEELVAIMKKYGREGMEETSVEGTPFEGTPLEETTKKDPETNETHESKPEDKKVEEETEKSVSNLTFDYPVVLEFFQNKQHLHYLITNIILATQALTVADPDVFKGMKDDENPLFYNRDLMKDPKHKATILLTNLIVKNLKTDKGDSISLNVDTLLSKYLVEGMEFYKEFLDLVKSLIEERETIVNYATRVMHDDFNVQLLVIEQNNTAGSDHKDEVNHSFITGKKKTKDIPWFLEGDDEFDLLTDVKGNIKGGTKEALVCHLTHHDLFDSTFNTAFLLTFPTIMSVNELVNLLTIRFNIEAPEGLSYEEYNTWVSKKQNPIRLRVLNIMKLLLEKYWVDSYNSESLFNKWLAFLQSKNVSTLSISISKTLISHLNKLLDGETVAIERKPVIPPTRAPAPLLRYSIVKKLRLLDIDYIELARQLTIREFNLYSKITKFQCLSKVWNKKSGLNESTESISNFIKASNQLTNFVSYMTLRKQDIKKRVQIIRYFVQVAERCRQYNNFSSMTAIISALYSSPIHRLKKTWKYVSSDTLNHLRNMNKLMNSSRNFNEYRDVLKFIGSDPCVPFFGVYLSDLTFVYHGNPDTLLNRTRMINFSKRAKTADILLGLDRFKLTGYNLLVVPEIQKYLDGWFDKCPTIEEQYQLSLNLEPRENGTSGAPGAASKYRSAFPFSRI